MQSDVDAIDYNAALLNWFVLFLIIAVFYFIARSFFRLARKNGEKESWLFGLIGIVMFFVGAWVFGFLEPVFIKVNLYSSKWFSLTRTAFGFLFCWGVYKYLSREWRKKSNR